MDEKKRELVLKASQIYMKYGIKSVTMDEMARQMGVSKKTLYQFVKDKNDLVEQCVLLQQTDEKCKIQEIVENTDNAIEQILQISRIIMQELQQIHPSIFFDLAKYHPSAMEMMECHKDEFVRGCIEQNLMNGVKQGLYRENMDVQVISAIYLSMLDFVLSGQPIRGSRLRPDEIYSEMFRYHIRGLASEAGLEYLVELIKNDNSLSYGI